MASIVPAAAPESAASGLIESSPVSEPDRLAAPPSEEVAVANAPVTSTESSGTVDNAPAQDNAQYSAPMRDVRIWTDSTGKHHVEAELVEAWNGVAYLSKGSKTKAVPLRRLSKVDQTYVANNFPVQVIVGKVIGVTDGDTLTVSDASDAQIKVRLDGIDAPEKKQLYSRQSTNALAKRAMRQAVRVEWRGDDKDGHVLGNVFVGDEWLNKTQLAEGWAWHLKKHNQSAVLAQAEFEARERRLGIWADASPQPPWDYRAEQATARAPPATRARQSFAVAPGRGF